MIGTWRLGLALLVVCAHLFQPWWPAALAVFSFYVISGFLMALILQERYTFSFSGLRGFWINRALRIYPPYYFACLISLALILLMPEGSVSGLNGHLTVPNEPGEIASNLLIFGLIDFPEDRSSLVPPGWTLCIELVYYVVISLWAARSRNTAYLFLSIATAWIVYVYATYVDPERFGWRYFSPQAGAFPFAVGVVAYFHKNQFANWLRSIKWSVAFALAATLYGLVFAIGAWSGNPLGALLYINVIATAILLLVLWHAPASALRKLDKRLGDLSYPVYLLHWQAGVVVLLALRQHEKTALSFVLAIGVVLIFAWLETKVITGPIETARNAVKRKMPARPPIPQTGSSEAA